MPDPKEVQDLLEKVRRGNDKMMTAIQQTIALDAGTPTGKAQWKANMDVISERSEVLRQLCLQLKNLGYRDCLYLEDVVFDQRGKMVSHGKKYRDCSKPLGTVQSYCQVCSSDVPYLENGIFNQIKSMEQAKVEMLPSCINAPDCLCSRRPADLQDSPCVMKVYNCGFAVKKPNLIPEPKKEEEQVVLF